MGGCPNPFAASALVPPEPSLSWSITAYDGGGFLTVELGFSEAMNETVSVNAFDFDVFRGGGNQNLSLDSYSWPSSSILRLEFDNAVQMSDLRLFYSPAGDRLETLAGSPVSDFSDDPVDVYL